MTALRKHRVEQMKARMLAGSAWIESDYVFTNALGEHLKHVTVYKGYKRIAQKLGIPSSRYHDLRHPYVKHTLKNIFQTDNRVLSCTEQRVPDFKLFLFCGLLCLPSLCMSYTIFDSLRVRFLV
jgi:hypothetical protein